MTNGLLLWADDEMELLRAHLLFLEKKGYEVVTVTNGNDAIEECRKRTFDLVLLDEMMPGLSGLETLQRIKEISPQVPIVMVTKSEEEDIMNQAIGQQIADYLIKPVNPNQILLSLKKNIHRKEIITETVQASYQQQFQQLSMQIMDCRTWQEWVDIYKRLVRWELELSATDSQMTEMLNMQKEEANRGFGKYIKQNYMDWMSRFDGKGAKDDSMPILSPELFKTKVFPLLNEGEKVFLIVLDSLGAGELPDPGAIDGLSLKRLYAAEPPSVPPQVKIDVAEGARLDLDYDGTVQVCGLSLAGRGQVGVVDATTCPGFLTGRGKLDVRPNGTIVLFR